VVQDGLHRLGVRRRRSRCWERDDRGDAARVRSGERVTVTCRVLELVRRPCSGGSSSRSPMPTLRTGQRGHRCPPERPGPATDASPLRSGGQVRLFAGLEDSPRSALTDVSPTHGAPRRAPSARGRTTPPWTTSSSGGGPTGPLDADHEPMSAPRGRRAPSTTCRPSVWAGRVEIRTQRAIDGHTPSR
jgi:hypothetical protein